MSNVIKLEVKNTNFLLAQNPVLIKFSSPTVGLAAYNMVTYYTPKGWSSPFKEVGKEHFLCSVRQLKKHKDNEVTSIIYDRVVTTTLLIKDKKLFLAIRAAYKAALREGMVPFTFTDKGWEGPSSEEELFGFSGFSIVNMRNPNRPRNGEMTYAIGQNGEKLTMKFPIEGTEEYTNIPLAYRLSQHLAHYDDAMDIKVPVKGYAVSSDTEM